MTGMSWLGLDWRWRSRSASSPGAERHAEVARQSAGRGQGLPLLSPVQEEIDAFRDDGEGRRAPDPLSTEPLARPRAVGHAPGGRLDHVIRIKAPRDGATVIATLVQGDRHDPRHDQLDDLILLRSDGTPTYMLAVVVDDHDMGVTHVIRGDDHLTNAARQMPDLPRRMGWDVPVWAHIPLIHGARTARRLSKRHGATQASIRSLPGHGLPAAGDAQLSCCVSAGATATTSSSRPMPRLSRVVRPRVRIGKSRGPLRFRQAREPQRPAHPGGDRTMRLTGH